MGEGDDRPHEVEVVRWNNLSQQSSSTMLGQGTSGYKKAGVYTWELRKRS